MSSLFLILTSLFIVISVSLILIILVQRPAGGGLAGAFGGAGGGGNESVFGGRVGDALTYMTIGAFGIYLLLAISLNLLSSGDEVVATVLTTEETIVEAEPVGDDVITIPGTVEEESVVVPEAPVEVPAEPAGSDGGGSTAP